MIEKRLAGLRAAMDSQQLDCLMVTQPNNIRYMSGFTSPDAVLLITAREALIVTDSRYFEQAEQQAPDFMLIKITERMRTTLAEAVASLSARRLGFESHAITVELYNDYRAALPPELEWVSVTNLVEGLRASKDAAELETIVKAIAIADATVEHLMGWLKPGVSELEIAWEVEVFMRTHGAKAMSFSPITAVGENGAMAHAVPGERRLQVGEMLVIDIGAQYNGYCSDVTRSFCFGKADDTYLERWNLVLRAQQAAEAGLRAGMPGSEGDALARDVIAQAGYGDWFGHGLGHGVGLEIHEDPRLSRLATNPLPEGSVVTVEPGIYQAGWGGIRIEDCVFITPNGCQVLTKAPKVAVIG
ncbi:MAG: aminopeptidase P family protein [Chloroflexi bacterium]|nr:aminopeptidase P family protein [Chloroflexota bacterium]